jgi:hypothetical protein
LRKAACADRERLHALTDCLLARVRSGDYTGIRETWSVFERDFTAHLVEEDRYLLPLLEREAPAEAEAMRSGHVHLRELLEQMGREIDLHSLHETTVIEMVYRLRRHAAREAAALGRGAGTGPGEVAWRGVLTRVRDALAKLAGQVD